MKIMNIEDEMTPVVMFIYFKNGGYMPVSTTAKFARETIAEWRKATLHYSLASFEDQQKNLEELTAKGERHPYFLYYFMEGLPESTEPRHPSGCVVLPHVIGICMQLIEEKIDYNKQMVENQNRFFKAFEKWLKTEAGEEWWKQNGGDDNCEGHQ